MANEDDATSGSSNNGGEITSLSFNSTAPQSTLSTTIRSSSKNNFGAKQEPQSWGELLNSYRVEKVTPHPKVEKPDPIYRQTRERSLKWREEHRQINPVLQQFIDPKKEDAFCKMEQQVSIDTMNRAMDKSNLLESHFDIVTLQDRRRRSSLDNQCSLKSYFPQPREATGKKIDYNENLKYSESVELIDRDTKKKKYPKSIPSFDDFFLIYKTHNPIERAQQDMEQRDDFIKTKYDSIIKKKFHPIIQTHNDPNIEKREREKEERLQKETKIYKLSKEPHTVKKLAENKAYDVISKQVLDEDKTKYLQQRHDVLVERRPIAKVKYDFESELKQRDAIQDELNEKRALNSKTSIYGGRERMGETQFNILSGEQKKLPPPNTQQVPIWKHVEKEHVKASNIVNTEKGLKIKLR